MKNLFNCALVILAGACTCTAQTISAEEFIRQASLVEIKEIAAGKIAKQKAQNLKLKEFGSTMIQYHSKANTELMAITIHPESAQTRTNHNKNTTIGAAGTAGLTGTSGTAGAIGTTGNAGTTGLSGTTGKTIPTGTTGAKAATGTNGSTGTSGTTGNNNSDPTTITTGGVHTNSDIDAAKTSEMNLKSALQQLNALKGADFDKAYTQMMITDHKNAILLFARGSQSVNPEVKAFAARHLSSLRNHLQRIKSIH